MKNPLFKKELALLATLLFAAFGVRMIFFSNIGYSNDTQTYQAWFNTAATHGIRVFYNVVGWCDYPPFNVYFFWLFGVLARSLSLFGSNLFVYIMKLLPNLFDVATAGLIFFFVQKRLNLKWALLATGAYAFNPAVIFDAAVWGQFDAVYTFFLMLSLMLVFHNKPKLAIICFTLGILTKPQSIALAPLLIFLIYRKFNWRGLFISLLTAILTVIIVILPFEWSNPVMFLSNIYLGAYQGYSFTTINAFNLWGFGGMWQPETVASFISGWLLFLAAAALAVYFVHKNFSKSNEIAVLFAAFVLFFAFFMLPTRIHERYLFPAIAVLASLIPFLKKIRPLYIVLTATCLVNQAYVLSFLNAGTFIQADDPVALSVSLINTIAFLYVLMIIVKELWGNLQLNPFKNADSVPGENKHTCSSTNEI
ncbi:MAG: glycosyltransferase 87 family protein [Candidatus Bathyarchaeota archaeon]|nr:glycosyltransferase 87 family protein [Candidatus Bathyarchaeota archaeon]